MKKLIALLAAALLFLAGLPAALAEETAAPAVSLPITLVDYQKAYEAIIAANAPECTVSWSAKALEDGREAYMGAINDAFVSVMLLPEGEYISEVAVLLEGSLDESSLFSFLSMAGYSGAALLLNDETGAADATALFMAALSDFFSAMTAGEARESICGLPGGMSISPVSQSAWQYYFILKPATE